MSACWMPRGSNRGRTVVPTGQVTPTGAPQPPAPVTPLSLSLVSEVAVLLEGTRGDAHDMPLRAHLQSPALSVVLPAYNEEGNLERTVRSVLRYLEATGRNHEVVVVNDGSRDGTGRIADELARQYPRVRVVHHRRNRGYGAALRSGFQAAQLAHVLLMDSDGQFDIEDLERLALMTNRAPIVVGYRARRADPPLRILNAWLYGLLIRCVLGLRLRDLDCAFKLIPRDALGAVGPVMSSGALFTAELMYRLVKAGYRVGEVGVRHFPRRHGKQTGAGIGVILRMFAELWSLRHRLLAERQPGPGSLREATRSWSSSVRTSASIHPYPPPLQAALPTSPACS